MTKIGKDKIGLYTNTGGWLARPRETTIFKEGNEVRTSHSGGNLGTVSTGKIGTKSYIKEYWNISIQYNDYLKLTNQKSYCWKCDKKTSHTYKIDTKNEYPSDVMRSVCDICGLQEESHLPNDYKNIVSIAKVFEQKNTPDNSKQGFKEEKDPLTNERPIHKINKEKSKSKVSKVTVESTFYARLRVIIPGNFIGFSLIEFPHEGKRKVKIPSNYNITNGEETLESIGVEIIHNNPFASPVLRNQDKLNNAIFEVKKIDKKTFEIVKIVGHTKEIIEFL